MHILSRLRLRTKLALLMGLSALALVASIAMASSILHQRMLDDRIDKLAAVINSTIGVATSLENEVTNHQLTRDQAIDQLSRDDPLDPLRWRRGIRHRMDHRWYRRGTWHCASNRGQTDSGGRCQRQNRIPAWPGGARTMTTWSRFATRFRGQDSRYHSPSSPTPPASPPGTWCSCPASISTTYMPRYVSTLWRLTSIGGGMLLVTLLVAWLINRDITGSLGRLKTAMATSGEWRARNSRFPAPSGTTRSAAWQPRCWCSRTTWYAANSSPLNTSRSAIRPRPPSAAALVAMAETIEAEATRGVGRHRPPYRRDGRGRQRHERLRRRAPAHPRRARRKRRRQALANAQTVASAAEQLSASIREIGGQVSQSIRRGRPRC